MLQWRPGKDQGDANLKSCFLDSEDLYPALLLCARQVEEDDLALHSIVEEVFSPFTLSLNKQWPYVAHLTCAVYQSV